jgi:PIN domain nuclease of toxin-antitoxin system
VKGHLLDTNIILIAPVEPHKLSRAVQTAVLDGPNFLSVVSYWEVMLKSMKGSLDVGDPRIWWRDVLQELAATPLMLTPQHVEDMLYLPNIHKDPFDRILIAQAMAEDLAIVTVDREIPNYASKNLQVIT